MWVWVAGGVVAYAAAVLYGCIMRGLEGRGYPSPEEAERQMGQLAALHPTVCFREVIGQSTQGRALHAFWFRGAGGGATPRPCLLVTAQIHAVEYIGAYVARAVAQQLAEGYGRVTAITELLDRADVWIVPLLNPDGASRVWRRRGWSLLGASRFTANGVDPNRNFPGLVVAGRAGWNSARNRRGSAYYRGPHPLSEPECSALAQLCQRQRFCAAINFHSFGGVVFLPEVVGGDVAKATHALAVFEGFFQTQQPRRRYRAVPERSAKIVGQLDPFLLNAFGTPSVTVEVSRPGRHLLWPWNTFNAFWWFNPASPERWVENDCEATIHALRELLERTGGTPCAPAHPELEPGRV